MQRHSVLRLAILAALGLSIPAYAQTANEQTVEELRNTLVSVMEALVQKGLLTREQAQQIVANAQTKAVADAKLKAQQEESEKNAVVVARIPETVKQDIVKQVGEQVRPLVKEDVLADAKAKQWGVPGAMPDWLSRISLFGDLRLRVQNDDLDLDPIFCPAGIDACIPDYVEINESGTRLGENKTLNITANRLRERVRLRLGMQSNITEGITAVARLASGNAADPVSTNQTLGQSGSRFQVAIDQAYLKFNAGNKSLPWMTILAGRTPNPFLSTDLVWDADLNFDGLASTWRVGLAGQGARQAHTYLTVGAFPIQEVAISSKDKWLYAGQLGMDIPWADNGRFKLAASYYYFDNITGQRNTVSDSKLLDYTAPTWMQKGNTLFNIRLDDDDDNSFLYALAAEYHVANLTATVDIPLVGHKLMLTADYVRNLGYDENKVRILPELTTDGGEQIDGYQVELGAGTNGAGKRGDWRAYVTYKKLERDAVVDAYTDSDFHLGGTDAKGYIVRGEWWFRDRTSISLRHLSSRTIEDVPFVANAPFSSGDVPLDVAVTQLDVSTQF